MDLFDWLFIDLQCENQEAHIVPAATRGAAAPRLFDVQCVSVVLRPFVPVTLLHPVGTAVSSTFSKETSLLV